MQKNSIDTKDLSLIVTPLLSWYDQHARILPWRENPLPYHVWVSEIMLQQTRVETVKPYFDRWIESLPTLATLAHAPEEQVLKLWEGLGYYNRARNMQKAAKMILDTYGGEVPASYDALLTLPGIGEYTAGAVASIAFGLPVPCVDGNVLRVLTRILTDQREIDQTSVKKYFTEEIRLIIPRERPGDFNQALMELGATVCMPNGLPKCELCPLHFMCKACLQDRVMEFPVKAKKKPRKKEYKTIFLILKEEKIAIRRREESGLLANLWEFPGTAGFLTLKEAKDQLNSWGLLAETIEELNPAKHIFTHIEWHMTGYLCKVTEFEEQNHDFEWVSKKDLTDHFAIPSAYKAFYMQLLSILK
ncbi:A/G-specific adenine glycosylase [Sinanaerobacter chloroacetimidivorans]|uniref:Adenine DNA glycosylase n=1 Tax=Sinanaerobacter chloroacetimidivorans TaxID=2818044 RepID=A0A8J8B1K5_9FIRM|nr:A/G-specific adenine glycosylase [Sinanaerobacter chloroacetimidivorans]MBR0597832.1 A/G-specific adenine glycosylase [Sinanaerobacter chloroacetimidivorans]